MQDTIDSIMAGGVINPILVRPAEDGKFEVVSGHRRFRASELAGKADIKAIVREMDDDSLVEEKNESTKELARMLLKNKLVTFVGSDAHRTTHRPPNIKSGVDYISQRHRSAPHHASAE